MVTRLYLHTAASGVSGTLPSTEQSSLTADYNADAQTVNRSMDTTIGTSVATVTRAAITVAGVAKNYYWTKFISPKLNQTSVSANTWTYAFATSQDQAGNEFPVNVDQNPVRVNCYLWKPSNGTKYGTILDGNTASTVNRPAAGSVGIGEVTTFSGSAVSSLTANDAVIVFEVWYVITPSGGGGGGNNVFYYDGTNSISDYSANASAASYIETPETITFSGGGPSNIVRALTTETINIAETVARVKNPGSQQNIVRSVATQTLTIGESLNVIVNSAAGRVYASNRAYWQPHRPRIRIYARTDSTYATPLYTYDAFSDSGTTGKPVSLTFDSTTGNAGTFALEIEDSGGSLDPDLFSRGNRVFIECSKDGTAYQAAFKGLVRSIDLKAYGQNGKNLIIRGYSYLVRLSERIVDLKAQSALDGNGFYVRNDSDMLTNTILNTLLTNDSAYLYTQDDTALNSFFKVNNISSSNIRTWVPRFDAQLAGLNTAVESILEFSNSLLGVNMSTDELMLYNQDDVTSDSQVFLLTNKKDDYSDRADTTMYPLAPYTYDFGYDYPDSANRLIASIGTAECPAVDVAEVPPEVTPPQFTGGYTYRSFYTYMGQAQEFTSSGTAFNNFALGVRSLGNLSSSASRMTGKIYTAVATDIALFGWGPPDNPLHAYGPGSQVGSSFYLYRDSDPSLDFPNSSNANWVLGMDPTVSGPTLTSGHDYFIAVVDANNVATSASIDIMWQMDRFYAMYGPGSDDAGQRQLFVSDMNDQAQWPFNSTNGTSWTNLQASYVPADDYWYYYNFLYDYSSVTPAIPGIHTDACGGPPNLADAEPNFQIAADINGFNRIAMVEKTLTGLPDHIKTQQTMSEYMFAKLYTSSKPKFTFDFPSVSIPNILPKAGDLVCHVDTLTGVGTANNAIQTGIISQINYNFKEDESGVIGLRKLALSTSGIKRGTY